MAHYATLADFRFADDVHDIRGARVYDRDQRNIGKVDDVVFNHNNGDIHGLVVDLGKRKVLLSTAHLFRATVDEKDFQSDLAQGEIERLPAFETRHLHDDRSWQEFERRQAQALKQENERLNQEYKREFHDDPVEHRRGSDHLVTPEAGEQPPARGERYRVTAEDLTPRRMADVFTDTGASSAKLRMRPAGTPEQAEDQAHSGLDSPSWTGFQNIIRQNLHRFQVNCPRCKAA
jgi:hypothetical protein